MQKDDGSRNAIAEFMRDRDENWKEFSALLQLHGQYWKARVLLELIWEYEKRREPLKQYLEFIMRARIVGP